LKLHLEGRTALVTGATSGIGRGIAETLGAEGVRLAIAGRRTAGLEETAAAVVAKGGPPPVIVTGDMTTQDGPQSIASSALKQLGGRVDILVNNAGASRPLTDPADDAAWEESHTLNFAGARRLTNVLVAPMRDAKWGRIINLTGALVAPGWNASGAAKAALNSWSRTLAIQLAPHGVTVNAIAPGRINSEQIRNKLHPNDESRDDFIRQYIPMGYFGEPEDLAALVVFLSSPLARYISGAAIPVDGAMLRIS
jgi:3-oxoacyl-[acyl-carrier protein] reductase